MKIKATDSETTLLRLFGALAYNEEDNLFLLNNGELGFAFACSPASGMSSDMADKLNSLLRYEWPTGTLIQSTLWTSPDHELLVQQYLDDRRDALQEDGFLSSLTQERAAYLRESMRNPVAEAGGMRLNNQVLIITITFPAGRSGRPSEASITAAQTHQVAAQSSLAASNLRPVPLTAESYLRFMQTIFNGGADAGWANTLISNWDKQRVLPMQVLDNDNFIEVKQGVVSTRNQHVRVCSVKKYPDYLHFGMAARYLGDTMRSDGRSVRANLLISFNIHFPDHDAQRGALEVRQQLATRKAGSPLARFSPKVSQNKQSLDVLMQDINGGDRVVQCYLSFAVLGETEAEVSSAVSHLRSYYSTLGFNLLPDRFAVLPLLANMLPFGGDRSSRTSLFRYRTMSSMDAVSLLPIYADWHGTGTPMMTLFSRTGQIMPISPFDSTTNYNSVVIAESGAGKSFFVNEMLFNGRAMGYRSWVIDVGLSYREQCDLLGGDFISFDPERPTLCLNPFPLVKDYEDEADILVGLVIAMATINQTLSDFQVTVLREVMNNAWAEHTTELTPTLISEALLAHEDGRVRDVGTQLYPFTTRGEYGKYFNGPNNVTFQSDLTVLEMGELEGRRQLQGVVLFMLMYQIGQAVYLGDRSERKMLYIDESWDLFKRDQIGEFITKAFRRFRKYGGSITIITQSINDLYMTEGTTAIAENSANWYLLRQKAESLDIAQKDSRVSLDEYEHSLMRSLTTVPGQYSEIMCRTSYGTGVGKLVVSPRAQLLYSTLPEDVARIEELRRSGLSVTDAIDTILSERGRAA